MVSVGNEKSWDFLEFLEIIWKFLNQATGSAHVSDNRPPANQIMPPYFLI